MGSARDASPRGRIDAGVTSDVLDCVVVGAGFGGLGCALTLAEQGARVAVCETLRYPGGCASTFERGGHRFEAGATLFSGFDDGQLFARWIARHGMDVETRRIDPIVELRTPSLSFATPPDREALIARFCDLPDAPVAKLRAFFEAQREVADALWALFDDPDLLPPFGARELLRHLPRTPRYLRLLPLLGRPLRALVERHGLSAFEPLRIWLDAVCQITVQAGLDEAEAPFALSAMDYYFRGTRHVHGGIGRLAEAMCGAITALGGEVRMSEQVRSIAADGSIYRVRTRRGELRARSVVANVLPQTLGKLAGLAPGESARLDELSTRVEDGWGAAMLYLVLDAKAHEGRGAPLRPEAHHLELVLDPGRPMLEGNHLFCSLSGLDEARGPGAARTATVSTHVPLRTLRDARDPGGYVASVQARMRHTLSQLAPEVHARVLREMTASPRTFERFTGRHLGYVGGIPRRAGLHNYAGMVPSPVRPGLYLVGDTVFPGQSTLATAIGGRKLAMHLAKNG